MHLLVVGLKSNFILFLSSTTSDGKVSSIYSESTGK